jgi:hypothetical protein
MGDKRALAGSLGFISLADIFQILGSNNGTGVLQMTTQYLPHPGMIYFTNGNPVNAGCGPLSGIDAIYAMFGWSEGKFEFHQEEVHTGHLIKQSRMQIVLDALRMMDDGVIKKVGPPSPDESDAGAGDGTKPGEKGAPQVMKGPLVDYSYIVSEEEFRDGERILKEGGHGKWIWVILEGTVNVNRETANGPWMIARLGEGCFIGTFNALLFKEYARSASINAAGTIRLGLLDTERLSRLYTSLSADFRAFLLSLDARLRKITDKALELYSKQDKTKALTKDMGAIIEKGSPKEELFVILEGEAYVVLSTRKGPLPLLTLGKEEIFGFFPFLDVGHEPQSASIFGSKNLKTKRLDGQALQKEYNQLPTTFRNLIYNLGLGILSTTRTVCDLHEGTRVH